MRNEIFNLPRQYMGCILNVGLFTVLAKASVNLLFENISGKWRFPFQELDRDTLTNNLCKRSILMT